MTDTALRALLPVGLRDLLPPDAGHEAQAVYRVAEFFAQHGYQRVKPPLIEFEETLLDGAGAATAPECFRVMDPVSGKMMGLRADMTPQVARIAAARLSGMARPLRLSYAGEVLRVNGGQLTPDRQRAQAGFELIGSASPAADAEVITLAARALGLLEVPGIIVDISLPTLVPALLANSGLSGAATASLRAALDHKDAAQVRELGGAVAGLLVALLDATGPLDRALERLHALELPEAAARERDALDRVVAGIRARAPGLALTLDTVENRGFEYHAGVAFTLFSRQGGGELGRGGRYLAPGGEASTGATLFIDGILAVAPRPALAKRVFLPVGSDEDAARVLRELGWCTVAGLDTVADTVAEARRQGCKYLLDGEGVREV